MKLHPFSIIIFLSVCLLILKVISQKWFQNKALEEKKKLFVLDDMLACIFLKVI